MPLLAVSHTVIALPGAMRAGFAYYRAIPVVADQTREDISRGRIAVPVLSMAGDHSLGNPALKGAAEASIRQVASNVTYRTIPSCGHRVADERPTFVARAILDFLEHRRAAGGVLIAASSHVAKRYGGWVTARLSGWILRA